MSALNLVVVSGVALALFAGCSSAKIRARKEERDRVSQSAHIYCDFVNGEVFPDVEVATNLEMAKHCDSEKSMSVTAYHSPSDNVGLVFCCGTNADSSALGKDKSLTPGKATSLPSKDSGKDSGKDAKSPSTEPLDLKD
jgi:hypothetical protein